jgi:parallel beta-helix repeat protein
MLFDQAPRLQFDAIVGKRGTHSTIAAAIAGGANTIYLRAGVHSASADINLGTNGGDDAMLVGEDGAVIDFGGGEFSVVADAVGVGAFESTGTISIPNSSTTVTGVGTTFTNLSGGQHIRIDGVYYEIDSITTDLSLEIVETYEGATIAAPGIAYQAHSLFQRIVISNITVQDSISDGVRLRGVRHAHLEDLVIEDCGDGVSDNGLDLTDCAETHLDSVTVEHSPGTGIMFTRCSSMSLESTVAHGNSRSGFLIDDSDLIQFDCCTATANTGDGINLTGTSQRCTIAATHCVRNTGKGINTDPITQDTVVTGCHLAFNGTNGIDTDSQGNTVTGCDIHDNGSDGILGGTDTSIVGCIIEDNAGDGIDFGNDDNNTVVGNRIINNGGHGIIMGDSANDNVVAGNVIQNNTAEGIQCSGDNNLIANNRISGNGGTANLYITGAAGGNRVASNYVGSFTDDSAAGTTFHGSDISDMPALGAAPAIDDLMAVQDITDSLQKQITITELSRALGDSAQATATGDTTTTSAVYGLLGSMSVTGLDGDYLIIFSTTAEVDDSNEVGLFIIEAATVQQAHTEREIQGDGADESVGVTAHAVVTGLSPGDTVRVLWRVTGGATLTAHERTLTATRIQL